MPALIEAAEDGKQSVCLVELKARFDERRNIEWSRALERAGVHVVYGFPNLKIHAKAALVVRREAGGLRRYVHLGTGNYHAVTARVVRGLRALHGRPGDRRGRRRPLQLRDRVRQAAAVPQAPGRAVRPARRLLERDPRDRAGGRGRETRVIRFKVNALTDPAIIEALYVASQAGARDRPDRAEHLRPAAGREGHEREHPRPQRRRPLPRAQPRLQLRGARRPRRLHRQRRPDAAEPRPPARGRRAGRRRPAQQRLAAALDALLDDRAAWELRPTAPGSAGTRRRASAALGRRRR